MATKTTVRNILVAIKNAPHSASPLDVKHITGLDLNTIKATISTLVSAQYLKENRECANTFFTRKPKRPEIAAFISGDDALSGVTFDVEGPTTTEAAALRTLRNSPHATSVTADLLEAIYFLTSQDIVKEHRDYRGRYFVKKDKRSDVDAYLAGTKTYEQLLGITPGVAGSTNPVAAPALDSEAVATAKLLHFLRTAPYATQVPTAARIELNELVDANIVKEHRDKPGFYFVRKTKRELVDSYLDGTLALDALYDASNDLDAFEVMAEAEPEAPSVTDATEALMNELEEIRERVNAILTSNGR